MASCGLLTACSCHWHCAVRLMGSAQATAAAARALLLPEIQAAARVIASKNSGQPRARALLRRRIRHAPPCDGARISSDGATARTPSTARRHPQESGATGAPRHTPVAAPIARGSTMPLRRAVEGADTRRSSSARFRAWVPMVGGSSWILLRPPVFFQKWVVGDLKNLNNPPPRVY